MDDLKEGLKKSMSEPAKAKTTLPSLGLCQEHGKEHPNCLHNEAKPAHTPTPWQWGNVSGHDEHVEISKMGYASWPSFRSVGKKLEQSRIDASFIIEACNNYDRLKAENEELKQALQGMIEAQSRDAKYNRIATEHAKKVLNG